MGVINMAHGEFIMAGCYTAFVVQQVISNAGASLLISLVVGFVVGGLLGVLLEVTLIQRMYDRPLDTLLVTFGVGLILQQVARDIFGAPAVNVDAPVVAVRRRRDPRRGRAQDPDLHPGARRRCACRRWPLVLKASPMGRRIRAVVQNRDLAETSRHLHRARPTQRRSSSVPGWPGSPVWR